MEKNFNKNQDSQVFINDWSMFQNLATVDYAIFNKNVLSNSDQYKLKGAIIQERFFKIKEKDLDQLSLKAIKASNFASKRSFLLNIDFLIL